METPDRSDRCERGATAWTLPLQARHGMVVAFLTLAGVGCGSSSGPSSTSSTTTSVAATTSVPTTTTSAPTTTTSAPTTTTTPTTTSVPAFTGSFTVQNTPCIAPQSGQVSCTFAASATGGTGTYDYSWTFAGPIGSTGPLAGPSVRPDLGCGLSVGSVSFNVAVTLRITSGGTTITVGPTAVVITRASGACGT
jgi:hypothetical protein